MKKITLIISFAFSILSNAQTAEFVGDTNQNPNNLSVNSSSPNATSFLYDVGAITTAQGNAGVVYFGSQFWVSRWGSAVMNILSSTGTFVETFEIAGVTGTRGMTTNGVNIYIADNTATIKVINPVTKTLISTIPASVGNLRYVTFDASLNSGMGGFWVGNFNTDFTAISMTGSTLITIPAATHTLTGVYGLAHDAESNTLFAYSQIAPSNDVIVPISLPSGTPGAAYDVFNTDLISGGTTSSLAGGIFVSNTVIPGATTVIAVSQATPSNILLGINRNLLNLSDVKFDLFSVYPNPATNFVTVSGNGNKINTIEVSDINGRIVKNMNGNGSETQINISDLSQGVYMLKISSDEGITTKKIIKE